MTKYKGNLELNWINKDQSLYYEYDSDGNPGNPEWIDKDNIKVSEPRILKLVREYGDVSGLTDPLDNALIRGDNLLALRTLVEIFKEREEKDKVKCVYLDPPYNTGNAFEHYDDNLEHSQWLTMMRDRLILIKQLLSNDGVLVIQIDDKELARLYLLMAEIFSSNELKIVCIKMSEASGLKMASIKKSGSIPKLKEYIIIAKKGGVKGLKFIPIPKEEWDTEYNLFINNYTEKERELLDEFKGKENLEEKDLELIDNICSKFNIVSLNTIIKQKNIKSKELQKWLFNNSWRICRTAASESVVRLANEKRKKNKNQVFTILSKRDKILYFIKGDYSLESKKPRVQLLFAEDNLTVHPGDLWTDIKTTGLESEGGVEFKNGKKPEDLLRRIIYMSSEEGDLVLDSFLGSGTTAAVAHKMKRRWIGIEIGKHAETHCIKRMNLVLDEINENSKQRILTNEKTFFSNGFRYYKIGESLLSDYKMNWNLTYEELAQALFMNFDYLFKEKINDNTFFGKSGKNIAICIVAKEMKILKKEEIQEILDKIKNNKTTKITIFTNHGVAIKNEDLPDNITIKKIPESILRKYKL